MMLSCEHLLRGHSLFSDEGTRLVKDEWLHLLDLPVKVLLHLLDFLLHDLFELVVSDFRDVDSTLVASQEGQV